MNRYIVLIASLILLLSSCDRSPQMLYVAPIGVDCMTEYVASNSPLRISIKASSKSSPIKQVTIRSYDEVYLYQDVLDSSIVDGLSLLDTEFLYTTGSYPDTTTIQMTTTIHCADGTKMRYTFRLYVLPDGSDLQPSDAITMYSASSRRKSGFSFPLLNTIYPDSNRIDSLTFYDLVQPDTLRMEDLSRCWYSKSGIYFARSESFDYAEATVLALSQTFSNCKRDSVIYRLKNDDIILFGKYNEVLGAIKILLIDDPDGTEDDRYVFSMKYIK